MSKKYLHVAGARPNFVKVAPVLRALKDKGANNFVIHTGQHYDHNMTTAVAEYTENYNLNARNVPEMVIGIKDAIMSFEPHVVIVYGDTDSALAGALAAAPYMPYLAHVEAGLRSFDWSMPEERNRYTIDQLSDVLFAPSFDGAVNLRAEKVGGDIRVVGNVMIDQLLNSVKLWERNTSYYGLVTLHRPFNVDDPKRLQAIFDELKKIDANMYFPVHPRTEAQLGNLKLPPNIIVCKPFTYQQMLMAERDAMFVITDSGGVQEETTYMDVPCFTLRPNTERPITIDKGTNHLVNLDCLVDSIIPLLETEQKRKRQVRQLPMWDGEASLRIAECLESLW